MLSSTPGPQELLSADPYDLIDFLSFTVKTDWQRLGRIAVFLNGDHEGVDVKPLQRAFTEYVGDVFLGKKPEAMRASLVNIDSSGYGRLQLFHELLLCPFLSSHANHAKGMDILHAYKQEQRAKYEHETDEHMTALRDSDIIAKAAVRDKLEFTDGDGLASGGWGEGSELIKDYVKGMPRS